MSAAPSAKRRRPQDVKKSSRHKSLRSKSRLKPVNAKRRKSEYARCYESRARVEWVKHRACLALFSQDCDGPIENAHIVGGGAGRKADARYIVPLCHAHHHILHVIGTSAFERAYTVSLAYGAELTEQAWQRFQNGSTQVEQQDRKDRRLHQPEN